MTPLLNRNAAPGSMGATRAWRTDIGKNGQSAEGETKGAAGAGSSDDGAEHLDGSLVDPAVAGPASIGDRGWKDALWRIGRAVFAKSSGASGFARDRFGFEETLHRMADEMGKAGSSDAVKAALLDFARAVVPNSRVALVLTPARGEDTAGIERTGDRGDDVARHASQDMERKSGETSVEFPLSCGAATQGRLRLLTLERNHSALSPDTLRRLATACTMTGCVLEHLQRHSEWTWTDPQEFARERGSSPSEPNSISATRDATFLSAVLPFALAQARRHREPVSLLCLGIDRLRAIRELLGPEVIDHLVQTVCQTVSSVVRSSDIVARLEDNRIVVLLIRAHGPATLKVARNIGRAVREMTQDTAEFLSTTVSIGIAEFPSDATTAFSLLDAADDALARGQCRGHDQVMLARSALDAEFTPSARTVPASLSC